MKQKFDNLYWSMRFRFLNMAEDFLKNEEGDSNMVSIIVLIVIILAVAVIFREQLINAVNAVFENLMDFIG